MDRRQFLKLAAPAVFAGHWPKSATAQPRPDWNALAGSLAGELIRPQDDGYETGRKLYSPRFDQIRPAALAYCRNPSDVRECLRFARHDKIPVHVRSGGHSYAGWSTGPGLLVDVGRMDQVSVDAGSNTATVGAGTALIDVYDRLAAHGLALPGGTCADLGIAGLTLGGGIGVISRAYGLTCDNLRAVDLVTADGEILTCDAERDPDLFWACRGGGGGNFGIATSFVFQTRPARDITRLSFEWPWSRAARVMQAWQEWAPLAPDEVWSQCYFGTGTAGEPPVVKARAVVLGSRGDLEGVTEPLLARVGAEPVQTTEAQSYLATMLTFAGCDGWSVAQCRLSGRSPEGRLQRAAYAAKSDFFDKPLPADALDAIVHHIEQGKAVDGLHHGELTFGVLGGAVGRIHPAETAFVHRRAIFDAQYLSFWQSGASAETEERSVAWLRSLHRAMRPHATGGAYVNYIDPELPDWQNAYYGANYARLLRVKARYDPHQVFRFPQAIGTA